MSFTPHMIAIIILILCSSYFSGTEIAYTSVREERVREKYEKKKTRPLRYAVYFLSHYDDMLAAILIGNNVVNLTASSISTVVVVSLLGERYSWVATVVMTVLILIFGEVLPKSVGKALSEQICIVTSVPLRVLSVMLRPAVTGVNFIIDRVAVLWSGLAVTEETITEDELSSVMDIVESEGVIDGEHTTLVKRAIGYKDIRAYEIITPRVDLEYIDISDTGEEIIGQILASGHSRLPVCDGDADDIIGVLHLNKFLFKLESGEITGDENVADSIRALCSPPIFIPRTLPVHSAVDLMREHQQQLIFVVDSYGGVMGILTMEDAIEVIVGDIWDESDTVEPDMVKIGEDTYDVGAQLRLHELFDELGMGHAYDEICEEYTVLGGWCAHMLGLDPKVGDSFTYRGLTFTVRTLSDRTPGRLTLTVAADDVKEDININSK